MLWGSWHRQCLQLYFSVRSAIFIATCPLKKFKNHISVSPRGAKIAYARSPPRTKEVRPTQAISKNLWWGFSLSLNILAFLCLHYEFPERSSNTFTPRTIIFCSAFHVEMWKARSPVSQKQKTKCSAIIPSNHSACEPVSGQYFAIPNVRMLRNKAWKKRRGQPNSDFSCSSFSFLQCKIHSNYDYKYLAHRSCFTCWDCIYCIWYPATWKLRRWLDFLPSVRVVVLRWRPLHT